jgi:hypothetical protein
MKFCGFPLFYSLISRVLDLFRISDFGIRISGSAGLAVFALCLLDVQAKDHLWDTEPSLWQAAQEYTLSRPLPAKFGVEGPTIGGFDLSKARVTAANPQGEAGINLSNGKLKASLWGRLTN